MEYGVSRAADRDLAQRVARMLRTAAAEEDWRRTWARVNRAAGMVAAACADSNPTNAGVAAEELMDEIATRVTGDARRVRMVVDGLTKRVGRALLEWYTGESQEEGKVRASGEGAEEDQA